MKNFILLSSMSSISAFADECPSASILNVSINTNYQIEITNIPVEYELNTLSNERFYHSLASTYLSYVRIFNNSQTHMEQTKGPFRRISLQGGLKCTYLVHG